MTILVNSSLDLICVIPLIKMKIKFWPGHHLHNRCFFLFERWMSVGYHCQRRTAEALVWVFEEQGQEDRALAHLGDWESHLQWLITCPQTAWAHTCPPYSVHFCLLMHFFSIVFTQLFTSLLPDHHTALMLPFPRCIITLSCLVCNYFSVCADAKSASGSCQRAKHGVLKNELGISFRHLDAKVQYIGAQLHKDDHAWQQS